MRRVSVGSIVLAAVIAAACEPAYLGEEVGTYRVTGVLMEHECGEAAVPTPSEATFDVTLRADQSSAWWVLAGAEPAPGRADGDGHYTFRRAQSFEIIPPGADGSPGCVLVQEDVVEVRVATSTADAADAGAGDGTPGGNDDGLTGTEVFAYRPLSSPGCRPILASQGGGFATLPCEIHIDLAGTPR